MKLHADITINGQVFKTGTDIAWWRIYPFFFFHMLVFGVSGFFMAYTDKGTPLLVLYLHGGLAITVYTVFYLAIFGIDEVKWMFINAFLGLLGIYSQIDWLLSCFGKEVGDYRYYVHPIPFLYHVLYTFLLRQAVLDITRSRDNAARRLWTERAYIGFSAGIYGGLYILRS
jgi:hypothetical protein